MNASVDFQVSLAQLIWLDFHSICCHSSKAPSNSLQPSIRIKVVCWAFCAPLASYQSKQAKKIRSVFAKKTTKMKRDRYVASLEHRLAQSYSV